MSIIKQKQHLYDDENNGIIRRFDLPGSSNRGPDPATNINTCPISIDFLYIHIPKTGGTSVHRLLGGWDTVFEEGEIGVHRSVSSIEFCNTDGHGNLYDSNLPLVYFVRNPYDRLVSSYHHATSLNSPVDPETLYKNFDLFVQRLTSTVKLIKPEEINASTMYTGAEGATEYVSYLDKQSPDPIGKQRLHSALWGSQVSWVTTTSDKLRPHLFYKFENIDVGFKEITTKFLNMRNNPKLPHLNKSSNRRPYQEYYKNPQTAVSVYKFYKKDFERFGYSLNVT